ncbi:hypothetical protein ZWY2020_008566, partial [Hordeum vulgare]
LRVAAAERSNRNSEPPSTRASFDSSTPRQQICLHMELVL